MSDKKRKITYKETTEKPRFAGVAVPKKEELSGADQLLKDIAEFQRVEVAKTLPSEPVNIVCSKCRMKVGYIIPKECKVPLRGSMIHPHRGCENWPLPSPNFGPLNFICPHAFGEENDNHLFINIIESKDEEADTFIEESGNEFRVVEIPDKRLCMCGCGEVITIPDKEYAGMECWKRHMMEIHGENPTEAQANECLCGCGNVVLEGKKYFDGINCYNRLRKQEAEGDN